MYFIPLQIKVLISVFVVAVLLETTLACECDYNVVYEGHNGNNRGSGCYMVRPASQGMACQCRPVGYAFICKGHQVGCQNPNHYLCRYPDTSKEACIFANGDCDGY